MIPGPAFFRLDGAHPASRHGGENRCGADVPGRMAVADDDAEQAGVGEGQDGLRYARGNLVPFGPGTLRYVLSASMARGPDAEDRGGKQS